MEEVSGGSKVRKVLGAFRSALVWIVMIFLSPLLIPFYYLPKWCLWLLKKGARNYIWDAMLSYIVGSVIRDQHGKVESIRFVTYGDLVHIHYATWGSVLCALLAWLYPGHRDFLAMFIVLLPLWSLIVIKWEFPIDQIWLRVLAFIVLVPAADYGLFKATEIGTQVAFPWLQEHAAWTGVTAEMVGGYEVMWAARKLFNAFGFEASPGLHLFAGIMWTIFFLTTVGQAWAWNRYEIDEKDLYRTQLLKGESREPVYMRGIRVVIKDVLETFPYGFATLVIRINGQDRNLRNVPGLAFKFWLRGAMDDLINSASEFHTEPVAPHSGKVEEGDEKLVRTFSVERGADSADHPAHQVAQHDGLGDHNVSAEDHHHDHSLDNIQTAIDAEGDL